MNVTTFVLSPTEYSMVAVSPKYACSLALFIFSKINEILDAQTLKIFALLT